MARKSKEADRKYYREYYATHKEEHKESQEKYLSKHPRIHVSDSMRASRLRYLYKMTIEDYESLLLSQGGHCALCQVVQGDDKRRMAVDHDHECCSGTRSCGKCLRGILCADCNRKVGFLEATLRDAMVFPLLGKSDSWTAKALRYLCSYNKTQETQNDSRTVGEVDKK
jgi:hypothetical protein